MSDYRGPYLSGSSDSYLYYWIYISRSQITVLADYLLENLDFAN